jgi:hypothetical protein
MLNCTYNSDIFYIFITLFYNFDVSNFCILDPWRWSHGWPKHVGVQYAYELILMYLCAFAGVIIVCVCVYIHYIYG